MLGQKARMNMSTTEIMKTLTMTTEKINMKICMKAI